GDNGQNWKSLFECFKQIFPGAGLPPPGNGVGSFSRYFPVSGKSPEVINSHLVGLPECMSQTRYPPRIAGLFVDIPAVERISPKLPGLAEIIGRYTGNHTWAPIF